MNLVDVFFIILIFSLGIALLYTILNIRIMKNIDVKFNEKYKHQIHQDIIDFYRELESYSALFNNKINQLKKLNEYQSENLKKWNNVFSDIKKTRKGKAIIEAFEKTTTSEKKVIELLQNINTAQEKIDTTNINQSGNNFHKTQYKSVENKKIKETPVNNRIKRQNIAEELMLDTQKESYNKEKLIEENSIINNNKPFEEQKTIKPKNTPVLEKKESKFLSIVNRIGKSIRPIILKDEDTNSKEEKPNFANEIKQQIIEKTTQVTNIENNFRKENLNLKTTYIPHENRKEKVDEKNNIIEKEITKDSSADKFLNNLQEVSDSSKDINESNEKEIIQNTINISKEEMQDALLKMNDSNQRPISLKILLNAGLNISEIAMLTKISQSQLQATKSIYGL